MASKSFEELAYSEYSKLVAEIAALKEQVAQQKAYYESVFEDGGKQIAKHKETIAQQAKAINRYRTALQQIAAEGFQSVGWCWSIAYSALQPE